MLNEEMRKVLENVLTALESEWLQKTAAFHLLKEYGPANWYELIDEWCKREESKDLARKRFELARALIREAQSDSEALETLLDTLQGKQKPN